MRTEKWIQSAIGALIDTAIITMFTGNWSWFLLLWITSIPPTRVISYYLFERKDEQNEKPESRQARVKPFAVSEYYARMEKAALDILEAQEPVDQTTILWWGLDGMRLNEDGTLEWISRKKPKPVNQSVFYQPFQTIAPFSSGAVQSTRATIDALLAQTATQTAYAQLQSQLQSYQASYPGYYPVHPNGGIVFMYDNPRYLTQIQNCCCNRLI